MGDADGQIGKQREENGLLKLPAGSGQPQQTAPGAHPGEGVFPSSGQGGITGRPLFSIFFVSQADSWDRGRNRERSRAARAVPPGKRVHCFSFSNNNTSPLVPPCARDN